MTDRRSPRGNGGRSRGAILRSRFLNSLERLDAEERSLLALIAVRPDVEGEAIAEAALQAPDFDWDRWLSAAARQWLTAQVAVHVERLPALRRQVPRTLREQLALAQITSRLRVDRFERALAPALRRLQADGRVLCYLKGAALLRYAYAAGERPINDYDLLVLPQDFAPVCDALEAAGFAMSAGAMAPPGPLTEPRYSTSFSRDFEGVRLVVALHWELYPSTVGFSFDVRQLLERARPVPGDYEDTVCALCPEDTFIHYATQLPRDSMRKTLLRLADLTALLGMDGFDPTRLGASAEASGATAATYFAVEICAALGVVVEREPIPSSPVERLRLVQSSCWMLDARWLSERWTLPHAIELVLSWRLEGALASPINALRRLRRELAFVRGHGLGRWLGMVRVGLPILLAMVLIALAEGLDRLGLPSLAAALRERFWRRVEGD